jgi:phage terminase small subunit
MRALTSRQRLFVEYYALSGNGTRSAIRAGCNPASARTKASRWLANSNIQRRVEEIRNRAFRQLRQQVAQEISNAVQLGLVGDSPRQTRRGIALANRIRLYGCSRNLD